MSKPELKFPDKPIVPTKPAIFDDTQRAQADATITDLVAALLPVKAEIIANTPDVFHDTWNPDAHAEHVTLTIAECRAVIRAIRRATGNP